MKKSNKILKCIAIAFAAIVLIVAIAMLIYVNIYYKADSSVDAYLDSGDNITFELTDDYVSFCADEATTGIILYQGAKVDYLAYAPLAEMLAERGYYCAVVDCTFNISMIGSDKVRSIMGDNPDITSWYIGGHSLGGVTAASEIKANSEAYDGLILLASFSNVDITEADISVISVYGDCDGVLNMDAYTSSRENLPNISECVIEGGNHAQFGSYGSQSGDMDAAISAEQQQSTTADFIDYMIRDVIGQA